MMEKRERLRRVVIVCAHFARNLAYYRAGRTMINERSPEFWKTVSGNFLDLVTLEWCKLFAEPKGNHSWRKAVSDPVCFEKKLLRCLNASGGKFSGYIKEMRDYRDKFVAHLDDLPVMNIPCFDCALKAVIFYHRHVVEREANENDLTFLPRNLADYYCLSYKEASAIYNTNLAAAGISPKRSPANTQR